MTCLEHLIENCLCDMEDDLPTEKIMRNIREDVNLKYSGITADQCWEICQYVYYVFIQDGYERIKN